MARWKRDVILGVCFEIFFVIVYVYSLRIPVGTMGKMPAAQPGVYVRLWLWVFAALSLLLIINALRKKDQTVVPKMLHPQAVITVVLVAAYLLLMDKIGFFLSTFLFIFILIVDYSWSAGKFHDEEKKRKTGIALAKPIALYLLLSLVIVIATQYIFGTLLMVNLP